MTYSKSINPSFNINTTHGKIINRTNAEFNVLKERHKLSMYSMEDTPEIIINNTYGNIILRNNDWSVACLPKIDPGIMLVFDVVEIQVDIYRIDST